MVLHLNQWTYCAHCSPRALIIAQPSCHLNTLTFVVPLQQDSVGFLVILTAVQSFRIHFLLSCVLSVWMQFGSKFWLHPYVWLSHLSDFYCTSPFSIGLQFLVQLHLNQPSLDALRVIQKWCCGSHSFNFYFIMNTFSSKIRWWLWECTNQLSIKTTILHEI